jgi:hypothetical protein
MKIIKFVEFIKEDISDTPEEYIKMELVKLKRKIDSLFDERPEETEMEESPEEESPDRVLKMGDALKKGEEKKEREESGKISFSDLGLNLESSEISKYSSLYDNLVVKFSDSEFMYNLYITIPIGEAVPKNDKGVTPEDIKMCYIKFKKYDLKNFDLIGQITRNVEIKKVDEEYLVQLKIELDDEFDQGEKIEIET